MAKASFLLFDSKDMVRMVRSEVRDGKCIIKKKMFLIDENIRPKILKTGRWFFSSYKPFYIIRHDKVVPLEWQEKDEGLVNPISPTTLRDVIRNQRLQNLLKYKMDRVMIILFIGLGMLIGMIIGAILGVSIKH